MRWMNIEFKWSLNFFLSDTFLLAARQKVLAEDIADDHATY